MAIEIVSFPINSMVIFHSYVKLPEGTQPRPSISPSVPGAARRPRPTPWSAASGRRRPAVPRSRPDAGDPSAPSPAPNHAGTTVEPNKNPKNQDFWGPKLRRPDEFSEKWWLKRVFTLDLTWVDMRLIWLNYVGLTVKKDILGGFKQVCEVWVSKLRFDDPLQIQFVHHLSTSNIVYLLGTT